MSGKSGARDVEHEGHISSYMDLDVWKLSVKRAATSYRLTKKYPRDELSGMTSQIRRSSTSIAANITEGYGRNQIGQYLQFLRIAQGSARELETHLFVSEEVGLLAAADAVAPRADCERVCKVLRALIRSLEDKQKKDDR